MVLVKNGKLFTGERLSSLEKSIKQNYLSHILNFYTSKGYRHGLQEESYQKIVPQIDRMVRERERYTFLPYEEQNIKGQRIYFLP